jgi:hypothetical protein
MTLSDAAGLRTAPANGDVDRGQSLTDGGGHPCDELIARDKASSDIFWLKDKDVEDRIRFPVPDVLAQEIAADLRAALEQFTSVTQDLWRLPARSPAEVPVPPLSPGPPDTRTDHKHNGRRERRPKCWCGNV